MHATFTIWLSLSLTPILHLSLTPSISSSLTHTVYPVDEGIVAGVAHGQPVRTDVHNIYILVSRKKKHGRQDNPLSTAAFFYERITIFFLNNILVLKMLGLNLHS